MNQKYINSRKILSQTVDSLTTKNADLIHITTDGNDSTRKNRNRHFDVGIAEGNLIGVAAGFALKGMSVIINGISSFIITHAMLQIRNNICFPNLKVVMVGIGSGLSYGSLGYTHQTCEDVGLLLNMPNMKIYLPADALHAKKAIIDACSRNGPSYIRLRTGNEPLYYTPGKSHKITFNGPTVATKGRDIIIFTFGTFVSQANEIHRKLKKNNISAQIVDINSINVYESKRLVENISQFKMVCTLEEHYSDTGLGSYVSSLLIDHNIHISLLKLGIPKEFCRFAGSAEELLHHYKLDTNSIVETIKKKYNDEKTI